MSPVKCVNDERWITARAAASVLSTTAYSVQRLALEGRIRSKPHPPFRTLFSLTDVELLARSFDQVAAAGPRRLQPA